MGLVAVVDPTFRHQIDLAYYLMVLGLIALYGPGVLSLDSLVVRALERRFPILKGMRMVSYEGMPRVLIVGGGFGGVAAAKALSNTSCRVTLIDQRNTIFFSPCCIRWRPLAFHRPTSPAQYAASFAISQMFASCSAA
jgi:hypothetical protein